MDEKPAENPEAATQESESQVRQRFSLGCLTWPFIVLVVYVLSIGPVGRVSVGFDLSRNHPRIEQVLETIYAPIMSFAANSKPAAHMLTWYLRVWGIPA